MKKHLVFITNILIVCVGIISHYLLFAGYGKHQERLYRIPPLITTCRYKRGVVISEVVVICEIDILYVIGTYAGFRLSVFLTLYDTYITTNFIVRNSI